jgi:hypothetical protein
MMMQPMERHDFARVHHGPAGVHARQIDAFNRRMRRTRPGGDEQAVEGEHRTVIEQDGALVAVHRFRPARAQGDLLRGEMVLALAQVRAVFADAAREQIGNRHARVWRLRFVADEGDFIPRRVLAYRLGRDHARGPVAQNHVLHVCSMKKGRFPWNRPDSTVQRRGIRSRQSPRRVLVSLVGRPSVSQPRTL